MPRVKRDLTPEGASNGKVAQRPEHWCAPLDRAVRVVGSTPTFPTTKEEFLDVLEISADTIPDGRPPE